MKKSREELTRQAIAQKENIFATITQLKISSINAGITADEMESMQFSPENRDEFIHRIRRKEEKMNNLIAELEKIIQ